MRRRRTKFRRIRSTAGRSRFAISRSFTSVTSCTESSSAFYRETRAKFEKRKAQGCVCVDMECSALMALAQFRGIDVFEFFYAGDNLDREQWDPRSLSTHAKLDEKDRAAYLALELARKITL